MHNGRPVKSSGTSTSNPLHHLNFELDPIKIHAVGNGTILPMPYLDSPRYLVDSSLFLPGMAY
jgi:hypothetical protein